MKRIAATLLAVALAGGLAGCTGGSSADSSASPSASASADTTPLTDAATFTSAPGHDLSGQLAQTMAGLGIAVSSTTRQDRYGTWNPLILQSGAPVLNFDPQTVRVDDTSYNWNEAKVRGAWAAMASFLVEEWVDSELVWDDSEANRATVAQRVTSRGRFFFDDGTTTFADFLSGGGGLSPTLLGPWAVDQDWQNWRQNGFTATPSDDPTVAAQGQLLASGLVPAEPAPYVAGRPRVYVVNLTLVGLSKGVDDQHFALTAAMDFYRPVVIKGVDSPRYEEGSVVLTLDAAALDSGDGQMLGFLMGFRSAGVGYRHIASLAASDIGRLPALAPPGGPSGQQIVDKWMFNLPADAVADDDKSCATQQPSDWKGTYATFDLPPVSPSVPGCLSLWSSTGGSTTNLDDWILYPRSTVWGVRDGTVFGLVSVEVMPTFDSVTITVISPAGDQFRIQATVAPGTGPDWAKPVVASLRLTG